MEKYYDLIISLIKENKKYPECEGIIDEIVSDVYEHAKVVLTTVTDENVVESYLGKIVSTSMITVPRKLGIKSAHQKSETSERILEVMRKAEEKQEMKEDFTESDLNLETEDNFEHDLIIDNSKPDFGETEQEENDSITEDELEESLNLEEDREASVESAEGVEEEEEVSAEPAEEKLEIEETEELDNTDEKVPDVDKNLVDKMINGISQEDNLEIDENIIPENEDTDIGDYVVQTFDEADSEDNLLDLQEEDAMIDNLTDEEPEIITKETPDFAEELPETATDEIQDIAEIPEDSVETLEAEPETDETAKDEESEVFIYNRFDFTPQKNEPEYDSDEIIKRVNDIQSKYKEKPVIEIFRLKYKENLSIDEISEKLGISDEDILEVLNEFIYIVKD